MQFQEGAEIPGAFLGLTEQNVRLQLQITSESGKIPIRKVLQANGLQVSTPHRDVLRRLFKVLGFDNDTNEVDQTALFSGRHFKSDELVANLIDYMDTNSDNYDEPGFAQGIEAGLPTNAGFRNELIESLSSELSGIPGFTPARVQRLLPFVTATSSAKINVNAGPKEVLMALSDDVTDNVAQAIIDFRTPQGGGPFTSTNMRSELKRLSNSTDSIFDSSLIDYKGSYYEVITKVDFGTSNFMARAVMYAKRQGELPEVIKQELF
jgi:type II secretory pathway component PulK